jgi:YGGT family
MGDVRHVVREEQTVAAGEPAQTTVSETVTPGVPAAPVVNAAPVQPAATVQTTTTQPGDQVVQHQVAVSDVNPTAERAANMGWVNSLVWFLAGLIIAVLAIRFILAMAGADPGTGFVNLIYALSSPFRAPFAGIFGQPITYDGAAVTARLEFEDLVAIVVYALLAWGITKVLSLMLGTNRTSTTVYTDNNRRTQL